VVSLTYSSGGHINGRNYGNLESLIDKTSSIYLYVKKDIQFALSETLVKCLVLGTLTFQTKFKKVKHATPRNK
jgi:hypothetical protein